MIKNYRLLKIFKPGKIIILVWLILFTAGVGHNLFANRENTGQVDKPQTESTAKPQQIQLHQILKEADDADPVTFTDRIFSVIGLLVMIGIAFAFSSNKKLIRWRTVFIGIALQLVFALLILKTAPGQWVFQQLTDAVNILLGFTEEGARFVFGNLVVNNIPVGTPLGDTNMGPVIITETTQYANSGAFFAFNVLPTIIFFSSLMSIMYHLGIMQLMVKGMAILMHKTMKTSGAESLSAAANIFVGQTEAPLVIRPYIHKMTQSELMAVMTGGFATIAGGVLAAYVGMLRHIFPDIAGHLIAASVMSAPAALAISKIMKPETEEPLTKGKVELEIEKTNVNVIDAAANGASDGLKLALNVGAMILAFIALIAMINFGFSLVGNIFGVENFTFQKFLGWLFWPVAWIMGIPSSECLTAGQLLGEKIVINEFVAYLHLSEWLTRTSEISYRTVVILTYALCGFANFGSIAIQLGGIGGIAPERRKDLAKLGIRSMIAGAIACFITATIAGMIL